MQKAYPCHSIILLQNQTHFEIHYNDVIMSAMASSLTIVYSAVYSGTYEFPAQRTSNVENVFIWWHHHEIGHQDTSPGNGHQGGILFDHMMTSSNGNIFRVTGHLCGEFTGPGDFPAQRPVVWSFDVFFDLFWINGWVNNLGAGDLRCYHAHYDVIVLQVQTTRDI